LRFILKFLWHLERQNLKTVASLRTNVMPWPGYTVLEQNQHFSRRMVARCCATGEAAASGVASGRHCRQSRYGGNSSSSSSGSRLQQQ
jgi:hypothetical protein